MFDQDQSSDWQFRSPTKMNGFSFSKLWKKASVKKEQLFLFGGI